MRAGHRARVGEQSRRKGDEPRRKRRTQRRRRAVTKEQAYLAVSELASMRM